MERRSSICEFPSLAANVVPALVTRSKETKNTNPDKSSVYKSVDKVAIGLSLAAVNFLADGATSLVKISDIDEHTFTLNVNVVQNINVDWKFTRKSVTGMSSTGSANSWKVMLGIMLDICEQKILIRECCYLPTVSGKLYVGKKYSDDGRSTVIKLRSECTYHEICCDEDCGNLQDSHLKHLTEYGYSFRLPVVRILRIIRESKDIVYKLC